eukprot:CAMPEP_0118673976 /NCGR_PEP_ID=MMETSP0800-20121206/633_1 /TAXON_ID=210618 ORGANISM="Striatella unipunctata, Strain CCMP2910" /NCGR_SAMPLE_ID=MMETSP0800 /ASSEMBLY_ACC=CAM_ASM_000638 /LENGTH=51 /DNA_ID=CAMNT_0006569123 /DNA_START=126 /DNA_END=281 /DNA_ORIENTATION=-
MTLYEVNGQQCPGCSEFDMCVKRTGIEAFIPTKVVGFVPDPGVPSFPLNVI